MESFGFPSTLGNATNLLKMNREEFMERAVSLARRGMLRGDGGPFGAVVVRDGQVIGEGWNQVLSTNDPTAHGEICAIRDACARLGTFSLAGCEIHTTGQPCPMCFGAILWARIEVVYYGFRVEDAAEVGFDDREFFTQISLPADQRAVPSRESNRPQALALLREYASLPAARRY